MISRSQHGFNTSHVTLYQLQKLCQKSRVNGFNTSHVTLYPLYRPEWRYNHHVSIHLMLLFIMRGGGPLWTFSVVSIHLMLLFIKFTVKEKNYAESFNTSHVTLYRRIRSMNLQRMPVSIHLMLLFICRFPLRRTDTEIVSIHLMLLFIIYA